MKKADNHRSVTGTGDGRRGLQARVRLRVDREELAWAAGFFDGEGTTRAHGTQKWPGLSVPQSGTLTDPPQVLLRFQRVFGGLGYVTGPELDADRPHIKPRWTYHAHGYEVVQAMIAMMWCWIGPIKRSQAASALLQFRALPVPLRRPGVTRGRPLNVTCKRGHSYDDAYVDRLGRRYCRPCRDDHQQKAYRERKRRVVKSGATSGSPSDPR